MQYISGIPVWGPPQESAVAQMANCMKHERVVSAALMADHHLGYAVPVGGVIAYQGAISPSGVGFDIGCGNKAILTDARIEDILPRIDVIMDDICREVSFGIGQKAKNVTDHPLFHDDPAWGIPAIAGMKERAILQLGTVGSGNHYVDIFHDELGRVWVGVHFGSRGLGHKIASHYIKQGGGTDGMMVDPVVLDSDSPLGEEYIAAMKLGGRYAYAGRDKVCDQVARILGANILEEVHNHHNYAWEEKHQGFDVWVVRKGATPAFPGQRGFVGGTMGENSVILEGKPANTPDSIDEAIATMFSTVHGAGRVLSRTQAAGKKKLVRGTDGKKRWTRVSEGQISKAMMDEWVKDRARVCLRGAGVDESPHCYKRLDEVLSEHSASVRIVHTLTPIGVAMAGEDVVDPYKD